MRTAAVYLVLLAVAAGLYWYYTADRTQQQERERTERLSKRVFPHGDEEDTATLRDAVDEVHLQARGSSDEIVIEREEGEGDEADTWRITSPRALRADQTAVTSLLSTLVGLELIGEAEEAVISDVSSGELANYGLDDPSVRVALRYEGEADPSLLALGDKDPTGSAQYARLGDEDNVLIVQDRESSINRTLQDLRDKTVLSVTADEVVALSASDASAELIYRLERETPEEPWRLTVPIEDEADRNEVTGTINTVNNMRIAEFRVEDASPEDIAEAGLTSPEHVITVVSERGAGRVTQRLLLGPLEGGNRVGMVEGGSVIFTVADSMLQQLTRPADRFRSKLLAELTPEEIESIRYEAAGQAFVLEPASAEGEREFDLVDAPDGFDVEAARGPVRALIEAFRSLSAGSIIPEEEVEADQSTYGLDPPDVRVTLATVEDEEPVVISLGAERDRDGSQGRPALRSGRDAVFFLDQWRAEDLVLDLDALGLTASEATPEAVSAEASPEDSVPAPSPEIESEPASPEPETVASAATAEAEAASPEVI